MDDSGKIVNKVAESDIRVFNLESLWDKRSVVELDIAEWLFKGLVLKEKDFRAHVKSQDWEAYADQHLAIFCSTDAILPTWATMLVASRAEPFAASVTLGRSDAVVRSYFDKALEEVDWSEFDNSPVVIKGCASKIVPQSAYVRATTKLQQHASKLMFGEPCSAVPLWRKKTATVQRAVVAGSKPVSLPPGLPRPS